MNERDLFFLCAQDITVLGLQRLRIPSSSPPDVTKRCGKEEQSSLLPIYLLMPEFFPLTHQFLLLYLPYFIQTTVSAKPQGKAH